MQHTRKDMILPADKEERAALFCKCVFADLTKMLAMKRQANPLTNAEIVYARRMMKEGFQPKDVARKLAALHHKFSDDIAEAGVNSLNMSPAMKFLANLLGKLTQTSDNNHQIAILEFMGVKYLIYDDREPARPAPVMPPSA